MANLFPWQERLRVAIGASRTFGQRGGKAALARAIGIKPELMRQYINQPIEKPRGATQQRLADELGVSIEWLRDGLTNGKLKLQVVGYAGAKDDEWSIFDEATDIETVEIDFDLEDPIAIRVKGQSMQPVYRPGDLLVASRNLTNLFNKDCIVETTDGDRLIKFVTRISSGKLHLKSYNPAYEDRIVDTIAKGYPVRLVIRG